MIALEGHGCFGQRTACWELLLSAAHDQGTRMRGRATQPIAACPGVARISPSYITHDARRQPELA